MAAFIDIATILDKFYGVIVSKDPDYPAPTLRNGIYGTAIYGNSESAAVAGADAAEHFFTSTKTIKKNRIDLQRAIRISGLVKVTASTGNTLEIGVYCGGAKVVTLPAAASAANNFHSWEVILKPSADIAAKPYYQAEVSDLAATGAHTFGIIVGQTAANLDPTIDNIVRVSYKWSVGPGHSVQLCGLSAEVL